MTQSYEHHTDFMSQDFDLIGEPLNLLTSGQEWFTRVYQSQQPRTGGLGLVLGATAWMASLLCRTCERVVTVDRSLAMLRMVEGSNLLLPDVQRPGKIQFIQRNWLHLPDLSDPVSIVLGDNALLFLEYSNDWVNLCDELASKMHPGAHLITRVPSVPPSYEPSSVDEIICRFMAGNSINYTAVRSSLLFAHWNKHTYAIDTEQSLATFEAHRDKFDALCGKFPLEPNDLFTIRKYKGSGAVYYAPPLDCILQVLSARFRITEVHFGPYCMADHFPLIVATRK